MKKGLGVTIVVLVLAALVLGPAALYSHVRAARDVVQAKIEDMAPDIELAARARVTLRDLDAKILEYQDKLGDVADRATSERSAVERIQKEAEANKAILREAKSLIAQERDHYLVGGKTYSKEMVTADVMARVRRCDLLGRELQTRRLLAERLAAAETQGRASLERAKQVKREKVAELESLEARLAHAGLLRQVNDLASKLNESPLVLDTELKPFAELERRVHREERRADYIAADANGGLIVDWHGSADSTAEAKQALERVLAN